MPQIDMMATGANIKQIAADKGMKAKDIQAVFGFGTPQTVFKWFRGVTIPTIDSMVILAKVFDTTIDAIIVTM